MPDLQRPNLHDLVVSRLLQIIATSGIEPGQALPRERVLAEQLGVSRSVLRQGFAVLEDRGLITTRRGSGRFLRQTALTNGTPSPSALEVASIIDVLEARRIVEEQVAVLACERRTAEEARDLARLAETLNTWDDNLAFHVAVAAASHNFMLERLVRQQAELSGQLGQRNRYDDPAELEHMRDEHRAIAEAVVARDADTAMRRVRTHLSRTAHVVVDDKDKAAADEILHS
ncbi:FadR/GntR family transcriptional regulator [Mycobacterium sp. BMJ-28]